MPLPMEAIALSLDRIRRQGWPQLTILSSAWQLILYATIFNVNEGVALFCRRARPQCDATASA